MKKLALILAAPVAVSFCCQVWAATFNIANGDVAALKAAINTASNNGEDDTINLADKGTYSLTTEDNPGDGLPLISADGGHTLTINGNGATIQRSTAAGTPMFRVLYIDSDANVVLDRLTIANGRASGEGQGNASGEGGGIYNGGLYGNATLSITNSTFSNNSAEYNGGGIYNDNSTLSITNSAFSNNFNSTEYGGGGIFNTGANATLSITNSTFSGNSASVGGGGINNSAFHGNATLSITNSTFSNNSAVIDGGGINNNGFQGNATLNITNSTFSNNSADDGGGIYSEANLYGGNATLNITNSTFSNNSAGDGGGIYNEGSFGGSTVLQIGNTILKKGTSGENISNNAGGPVISLGYNLSDDGGGGFLTSAGDQINTDPMLGPLKDNGGPTDTHAPLTGSPAIDKGKDIGATGQDQRGDVRPVRFDPSIVEPPGGDGSDIGAVELAVGVQPSSAVSRKTHGSAGTFDINLPLSGNAGIECRSGGANNDYQMIVNFAQPVTFSSAAVTEGTGSVASSSGSGTAQVTINLTGVTNVQRITVALFDVNDGTHSGDVGVRMGVLVGDATGNGVVNASDIGQIKSQVDQTVSGSNFRTDVVPNGIINASDVALVKSKSGTALP